MGKRESIESLESGDHVGALGLAGDLAVAEKSPARVASAVREMNLTAGVHCQCHLLPSFSFIQNLDFWLYCKNHIYCRLKICETNFVVFLEMASF